MRIFVTVIQVIIVSPFLGIPLAILSLWYQNPPGCKGPCYREPCPPNTCMGGNSLTAGFPFPILHDDNAGSPVDGWGTIGGEDFISLDIGAFFLNAFFYGLIILILFVIAKSIFESVKRSIQ